MAVPFVMESSGDSPKLAFDSALRHAQRDSTIHSPLLEKDSFVMIHVPSGKDPYKYAQTLIDECDPRIYAVHGPVGCIKLYNRHYLFFGWVENE